MAHLRDHLNSSATLVVFEQPEWEWTPTSVKLRLMMLGAEVWSGVGLPEKAVGASSLLQEYCGRGLVQVPS